MAHPLPGDPAAHDQTDAHLREHTVEREQLLQGHFLQVRRDTVRLPDASLATREYVVHPGAVMVIPLLTDGDGDLRIVMERQYRHPLGQVIVEFPAGKRDGDEDLWLCAQRELREETGYRAREWAHAGVMHPLVAYSDETIDIWFARGLSQGVRQLDPGEFLDVTSASLSELLQFCRDGRITDGKTLAGALWLQNVVSGAWTLNWRDDPQSTAGR